MHRIARTFFSGALALVLLATVSSSASAAIFVVIPGIGEKGRTTEAPATGLVATRFTLGPATPVEGGSTQTSLNREASIECLSFSDADSLQSLVDLLNVGGTIPEVSVELVSVGKDGKEDVVQWKLIRAVPMKWSAEVRDDGTLVYEIRLAYEDVLIE